MIDTGEFYYHESQMFHGSLKNIMGTQFDILILGQKRVESQEIWNDIVSVIRQLDKLFNRFDSSSETSKINREAIHAPIPISQEMCDILKNCQMYHTYTLGLFDVTLNNFSKVVLDEKNLSVYFQEKNLSLDFGGYAKGYALLKVKDCINKAGVKNCFVDFGNSSIMGIGHHPYGEEWIVSFENPYNRKIILDEIPLKDMSLSVSGNTPSYTGHIVRPDSKRQINAQKAVSVIAENALDAEVLSTVFMMTSNTEKEQISKNFNIQKIVQYNLQT